MNSKMVVASLALFGAVTLSHGAEAGGFGIPDVGGPFRPPGFQMPPAPPIVKLPRFDGGAPGGKPIPLPTTRDQIERLFPGGRGPMIDPTRGPGRKPPRVKIRVQDPTTRWHINERFLPRGGDGSGRTGGGDSGGGGRTEVGGMGASSIRLPQVPSGPIRLPRSPF